MCIRDRVAVAVETARRAVRMSESIDGPETMFAALSLSFGLSLAGEVTEARSILEPLIPLLETLDPLGEPGLVIGMAAHMLGWIEDWGTSRRMLEHVVK